MFSQYYVLVPSEIKESGIVCSIPNHHEVERRKAVLRAQAQFSEQETVVKNAYRKCA